MINEFHFKEMKTKNYLKYTAAEKIAILNFDRSRMKKKNFF